ncbi:MAG: EthD domain-containing protein [Chitinophagaceae bacterium]
MIKMTMLLKRNPNLTHEAFVKHHIEKHGPLFRQIPEAREHVIRYIQTHPISEQSKVIEVDDVDGTAELWFDNVEGLDKVLSSEFYKTHVWPDELTFLDHANTKVTLGYQDDIIGNVSELKNKL